MDFPNPLLTKETGLPSDTDYHNIKEAARVLRSLNHPLRAKIIKTIHENKNITVTELYIKLRLEQSVASQHLAILRRAGIITAQRKERNIFYSMNSSRIHAINHFAKNLTG